ncbi:type II toxin-antitoxin system ParD family antitoxin [Asticcacaulis sp. W401b]|uniref:type II toxin-antitoxin system ParD family antitoxin n=1 Tax=Asticcacaulis sp. W401b TaxID=3388666 RepID=UPI003970EFCE
MGTSVSLGDHFEGLIKGLVENGRYNNASEVVRDGLRMVEARERRLAALDQALAEALTAEAEGRVMSLEDAAAQVKAKIRDAAARRAKA